MLMNAFVSFKYQIKEMASLFLKSPMLQNSRKLPQRSQPTTLLDTARPQTLIHSGPPSVISAKRQWTRMSHQRWQHPDLVNHGSTGRLNDFLEGRKGPTAKQSGHKMQRMQIAIKLYKKRPAPIYTNCNTHFRWNTH